MQMTIDITPEAVERLAYNLSDWGQHDEGLINDYRDDAAKTLRALSAALAASQAETAAAYEVAALVLDKEALVLEAEASRFRGGTNPHHERMAFASAARRQSNAIRALTPADSKAALDRMIADAEERGMREALDAASDYTQRVYGDYWKFLSNPIDRERILAAIPKGGE
jgi:hypothetical protein